MTKTIRPRVAALLAAAMLLGGCWTQARAAGEGAPDFPPGAFNDGGRYKLADFAGKVLVLFFYEKDCPSCRDKIPQRNAVVKQYQGKPVKFIAVAAGDTLTQAKQYAGATKLAMPVFADSLSLMEKRYGETISLNNIYQFRVIGPDGRVVGHSMEPAEIDRALEQVKPRFDAEKHHAKVRPAAELFEWNQYAAGMRILRPLLKNPKADVAESAKKLYEALKKDGEQWIAEAEEAEKDEPVKAYDLYTKVAEVFKTDELGEQATAGLRKLRGHKAVKDELAARKMYDRLTNVMGQASPQQKAEVVKFADTILKKHPGTPTAEKVEALKVELGA